MREAPAARSASSSSGAVLMTVHPGAPGKTAKPQRSLYNATSYCMGSTSSRSRVDGAAMRSMPSAWHKAAIARDFLRTAMPDVRRVHPKAHRLPFEELIDV